MNKILIRPNELQSIIEWAWANPKPIDQESINDLLCNAATQFMEDISQYEDKYLVSIEYKSYKFRFLCSHNEYEILTLYKGNLNISKNIQNLKWDDVSDKILCDPYEIARIYNPSEDILPKWVDDIINFKPLDIIREIIEYNDSYKFPN